VPWLENAAAVATGDFFTPSTTSTGTHMCVHDASTMVKPCSSRALLTKIGGNRGSWGNAGPSIRTLERVSPLCPSSTCRRRRFAHPGRRRDSQIQKTQSRRLSRRRLADTWRTAICWRSLRFSAATTGWATGEARRKNAKAVATPISVPKSRGSVRPNPSGSVPKGRNAKVLAHQHRRGFREAQGSPRPHGLRRSPCYCVGTISIEVKNAFVVISSPYTTLPL
jgi:hypothetical protein